MKDLKIRRHTPKERQRFEKEPDVPEYQIALKLTPEQEERLKKEFFLEFEALKNERQELGLEERWQELDNLYDGNIQENKRLLFNLNTWQARIKADAITRAIKESFLEVDPKFSISPRPEFTREDGLKVAEKQEDFLDYAMDEEIKPEKELEKTWKDSVKKYVGITKLSWEYRREKRKRDEFYQPEMKMIGTGPNGEPIIENQGLKAFLNNYPDAAEKYPGIIKQLAEGKEVSLVVEYYDVTRNNPTIKNVKVEDFYVSNSIKNVQQLRETHLIVERQEYSYWDLLKKEKDAGWKNIEEVIKNPNRGEDESGEESVNYKDYKTRSYNVLEGTYYFKINPDDEEEVKLKVWFEEDNKVFLGAIYYPYYGFDCDYIPFWAIENNKGFYGNGESVMWLLRDSNIAENALLNLALHGTYSRNVLTPIVPEGSELETLILENRWTEGLPLVVNSQYEDVRRGIDFVQYPPIDTKALVFLVQLLKQQDGDLSGVSQLMTGRESPTDPTAPATKTIALLQQSSINIKDYIRSLVPSFNEIGAMLLQLYYQMSKSGWKYKVRKKARQVTGGNPFDEITKDEMVARTNIQARAMMFALDKVNEKAENLSMLQLLMNNPVALQRPKLIYMALLAVMKSWSPMWKNLADKALPSPEELALEQRQVAVQAIADLVKAVQQQEQATGVKPQIDLNTLTTAIQQAQQEALLGAPQQKG